MRSHHAIILLSIITIIKNKIIMINKVYGTYVFDAKCVLRWGKKVRAPEVISLQYKHNNLKAHVQQEVIMNMRW